MIIDSNLIFDPAGTAITATAVSTNTLDMLNARDVGVGMDLKVTVVGSQTFASSGSTATLNIQLQGSPDNATWVVYAETGVQTQAQVNSLSAQDVSITGYDLPERVGVIPRYYRLNYVVASGPFTAGTVMSFISLGRDAVYQYPSGFTPYN